jgi:putative transposase
VQQSFRSNRNVVFSCKYHVIWCPKYRRPVLVEGVDAALKRIITAACKRREATLIEMEVMPDHVHLLLDVDPQYGIHRLVKEIKGQSSRELRQRYQQLRTRLPTLWSNSYFVATVGGAPLSVIKRYIAAQKVS